MIEPGSFDGCSSLTTFAVPDGVSFLGGAAFANCSGLTSFKTGTGVTRIRGGTFVNCSNLKTVTIDGPIDGIEKSAFENCTSLEDFAIPESVTAIGDTAFANCPRLTHMTLGKRVGAIGTDAFIGAERLTQIAVSPLNPTYSSLDGVVFNKGKTLLILCPPGKAGPYEIPGGVTGIGNAAFYGCTHITSVTVPDSVALIGDEANPTSDRGSGIAAARAA